MTSRFGLYERLVEVVWRLLEQPFAAGRLNFADRSAAPAAALEAEPLS
jgi:hypothetical protein